MNNIKQYIQEKLVINKNIKTKSCQPKNKEELRKILEERLKEDKNAYLNDIDVSNIENMDYLFKNLDPHNIDISKWDVSNVLDFSYMFSGCKHFTGKGLENWNVSKCKKMTGMFYDCEKFNSDLSSWDVSNVKSMLQMFWKCFALKNKPKWHYV